MDSESGGNEISVPCEFAQIFALFALAAAIAVALNWLGVS